jgi:hypothetical protein
MVIDLTWTDGDITFVDTDVVWIDDDSMISKTVTRESQIHSNIDIDSILPVPA